jgi:hypothetical protein
MTIVPLLLFCSLVLAAGSLVLFVFSAKQGDCHEAERMCLLPLEDDADASPRGASKLQDSTEKDVPCNSNP